MYQSLRLTRPTLRATRSLSKFPLQTRQFHPTRSAPFIAEALDSSWLVHGVHNLTGLSWVYSIPLTALFVRTFIGMPLQIFSRLQARREQAAMPVVASWRQLFQSRARALDARQQNPPTLASDKANINIALMRRRKEILRRLGVWRFWRGLPLLQLPVWLSVMETIRAMSGLESGLLAWLLSWAGSTAERVPAEPTLALEGALWFPDLLAGDATGVLPAALTASILLNIHCGWPVPRLRELADLPRLELAKQLSWRGLRLFVQIMTLNVGLSTYYTEAPVALLLYWLTSSSFATLQNLTLDKMMKPHGGKKNAMTESMRPLPLYKTPVRPVKGGKKQTEVLG
ncbi:putative mitochondrial export translocase Oxa2 [Aspergillus saccharolyticus JOP 1030-1]|uniref:Mitochondrial export translocase Oxa2 n=1 Tax=Aspergillus saccharolyticus JOP 1030-1 TaxID=1450539 RepID=A0A318ZH83_9EURO|nr:hypothetical protein BP01DRAFT_294663 [Aspergillus saccharolyticus JOP 1030-1]PYH46117.1 hypothetical protein BP01DRAFT_294663 [Aspergillus saccharolyticus JOP 1030-1]